MAQPIQLARNLYKLQNLLSFTRLQAELQDAVEVQSQVRAKGFYANSDTKSMVSTWTNHNHVHNVLGSYADLLSEYQCAVGGIYLYRIQHSVDVLPGLALDSQKLTIILKAQYWEMCRSLMMVFDWYRCTGFETASCLLEVHRSRGYSELKKQNSSLADFVDHILWYVHNEREAWDKAQKEAKNAKRRKTARAGPSVKPVASLSGELLKFGIPPSDSRNLPWDLYGIRPQKKNAKPIRLSALQSFQRDDYWGLDELYAKANDVMMTIWTKELIIPWLKTPDSVFGGGAETSVDGDSVLYRCLTRGAILKCIAEACGTDAIFASSAIKEFLAAPALVFERRFQKNDVFAKHALKDAVTTLEPLFAWLTSHVEQFPDMYKVVHELGDLVHLNMLELHAGRSLPLGHLHDPMQQPLLETGKAFPKAGQRKLQNHIFSEVTLSTLVPKKSPVGIGVLGLITREALADSRNLSSTNESLRRVLKGKHATQSSASTHNPDHTNPIRQYSKGAKLLYHHLPAEKLTTKMGLSNLLSWFGTGQGCVTISFLDMVKHIGGFFSEDLATMVNHFQKAITSNLYQNDQRDQTKTKATSHPTPLPSFITTHDAKIWGQSSNHLLLFPTYQSGNQKGSKYTLSDKFGQYFTSDVQTKWQELLGDMMGQDPAEYAGERHSWSHFYNGIKALNIPGFQQGLTVFQLANTLSLLGIAKMPHWSEMADFIAMNRLKGAFRGLEKLGFHMPDTSSVRAAFYCVHRHLEEHLTDEDKRILGFSPIFTEHLLCKVVRWAKHLQNEAKINLYDLGYKAEVKSSDWIAGVNIADKAAFPFPLTIAEESLIKSIVDAKVWIQ